MNLKQNSLAMAIGIAISTVTLPSYALIISTTVETSSMITINGITTANADGPNNTSSESNTYGYLTGASAKADTQGNALLGASSFLWYNPNTSHSAASTVIEKAVITNNDSYDQLLDLDFLIKGGSLFTQQYSSDENLRLDSSYTAEILINGVSLWISSAILVADINDYSVEQTGHSLNGSFDSQTLQYSWSDFSGNLNLGWLNAGETATFEYILNVASSATIADLGYGVGSYANIGDPFSFNSTPFFSYDSITTTSRTSVTEPAGIALLGAGLAGLAFRRKKQKTT